MINLKYNYLNNTHRSILEYKCNRMFFDLILSTRNNRKKVIRIVILLKDEVFAILRYSLEIS